jgi:hypothetical protein
MQNSKNHIEEYNKKLFAKLFENLEPIKPIFVTEFTDPIFEKSFAEIAQAQLEKIIENAEFDLEFETLKLIKMKKPQNYYLEIISPTKAKELYKTGNVELFKIFDDDTEAVICDEIELLDAIESKIEIAIERLIF